MDWHHVLRMQELHRLGRVFWAHYEMLADRQESEIDRHIFADQLHIGEKCRIPGVKNHFILYLDNDAGRLTKIDRTSVIIGHR